MGLWFLQIPPLMEFSGEINKTVNIKNGTKSIDLQCGKVPGNFVAIEWDMKKSDQIIKILKFYQNATVKPTKYYEGYIVDKYEIREFVNLSLVVKDIELNDTAYYICGTKGGSELHSYTTLLQVEGKSLLFIVSTF